MAGKITKDTLKIQTDKELIVEAKSLHHLIHVIECFGTKDMLLLEFILKELEERGYEIEEEKHLAITKTKSEVK